MNNRILSVLRNEEIALNTFFDELPSRVKEHSQAVAELTLRMLDWIEEAGAEEELPKLSREEVFRAVFFHDIGLSLVPLELLEKKDDLSMAEMRVIQRHTIYGGQLLENYRKNPQIPKVEWTLWQTASETAAGHHERWDGKGYPYGLLTSGNSLLSRVTAIVDTYDSISRGGPYRMPLPREYAALEIVTNAGKQFDPNLAGIFRAHCIELLNDTIIVIKAE